MANEPQIRSDFNRENSATYYNKPEDVPDDGSIFEINTSGMVYNEKVGKMVVPNIDLSGVGGSKTEDAEFEIISSKLKE